MEELKHFLEENNIKYKVTFGGKNNDIENIEIEEEEIAIIKETESKDREYCIVCLKTINFMWFSFEELKKYLLLCFQEEDPHYRRLS